MEPDTDSDEARGARRNIERVMREEINRIRARISQDELVSIVQEAAAECGIEGVQAYQLPPDTLSNLGRTMVFREPRYQKGRKERADAAVDLAYFERGTLNRSSVVYNPFVFDDARLEQFIGALKSRGLEPREYQPLGLVYETPESVKRDYTRWEAREDNALYKRAA